MLSSQLIKLETYTTSMMTNIYGSNPFEEIATNIDDLNNNLKASFDSIKAIADFFIKIGKFFKEMSYWLSHPIEVMNALQPWIIILLMSLIVLKLIGFKTDKWLSLVFLLFILILVF